MALPGYLARRRVAPLDLSGLVEDTAHAWMLGPAAHPAQGQTLPDEAMRDAAYSWCKAPRLDGQTIETGALARQVIDGHPLARALAGGGVLARVAGRLLELARLPGIMEALARDIDTTAPFISHAPMPRDGAGVGWSRQRRRRARPLAAGRGRAASPPIRSSRRRPGISARATRPASRGPLEAALEGAPVGAGETTPIAVQHIVRSFDPCMVCTVH